MSGLNLFLGVRHGASYLTPLSLISGMEIRMPTSQVIVRIQYNTCQMFITGPALQYKIIIISFLFQGFFVFFPDPMQLLVYRTSLWGTQERSSKGGQRL